MATYLTPKQKIAIKERHIKEDDLDCAHCGKPVDPETCVIAHLDSNPKNNVEWNHHPAHQQCNIEAITNFDYQLHAQELIRRNHSKIYAPGIEDKNEKVSTEVDINVTNRQLTKQKLTEWTIDGQKVEYSEAMNSITYLCTELTGHGSQKCVREYINMFCSSVGPFMIVKEDGKKMIQRRIGN